MSGRQSISSNQKLRLNPQPLTREKRPKAIFRSLVTFECEISRIQFLKTREISTISSTFYFKYFWIFTPDWEIRVLNSRFLALTPGGYIGTFLSNTNFRLWHSRDMVGSTLKKILQAHMTQNTRILSGESNVSTLPNSLISQIVKSMAPRKRKIWVRNEIFSVNIFFVELNELIRMMVFWAKSELKKIFKNSSKFEIFQDLGPNFWTPYHVAGLKVWRLNYYDREYPKWRTGATM